MQEPKENVGRFSYNQGLRKTFLWLKIQKQKGESKKDEFYFYQNKKLMHGGKKQSE